MSSGAFENYAEYYDLLNRGKDYDLEAKYVHTLIQRNRPGATKLLEFGCGTGGHARRLVHLGYEILGVDISEGMLEEARRRNNFHAHEDRLRLAHGDMRTYRTSEQFDSVLALFHVMSYMTSNADLSAAIQTAAHHLPDGGVLLFDCWYGPGVLTDPPTERIRSFSEGDLEVTRRARPVHIHNENRVDIHFDIDVRHKGEVRHFEELHEMRYLFVPEVALLLEAANLRLVTVEAWLRGGAPSLDTWNACFVAVK